MKIGISYTILILLVFFGRSKDLLYAQEDSITLNHIYFDCPIFLDGVELLSNECEISVTIGDSTYCSYIDYDTLEIEVQTTVLNSVSSIDSLAFRLNTGKCITDKTFYTSFSWNYNGVLWITSLNAESYSVQFPAAEICNDDEPVAIVSELDIGDLLFSAQKGLSIKDPGMIIPKETAPGLYNINVESAYCLSADSANVSILAKPEFDIIEIQECDRVKLKLQIESNESPTIKWSDNTSGTETEMLESGLISATVTSNQRCSSTSSLSVEVKKLEIHSLSVDKIDSDCWTDGKITILSASVLNNVGDFSYRLRNTVNGTFIDQMENVPEGEYSLQVIDSRNCIADAPEKLTVIQKCIEEYPVFTPNNDGVDDQYFIPYQGVIKIYNSENQLVKEIESPTYWDGTDMSGNIMPMGNYVMVTDQGRPVNITIVR